MTVSSHRQMANNSQQLKSGLPPGRLGIVLALSLGITTAAGYFMTDEQPADADLPVQHIPTVAAPIPDRAAEPPRPVAELTVPDSIVVRSAPSVEPDIHQDRNKVANDAQKSDVLHITNVGDRIVVSHEPRNSSATAVPQAGSQRVDLVNQVPTAPDESVTTGQEARLADYEDVYPGCPRVLPQGADEQMARQRQDLYGCQYLSSCEPASDESAASCTWYLVGKI